MRLSDAGDLLAGAAVGPVTALVFRVEAARRFGPPFQIADVQETPAIIRSHRLRSWKGLMVRAGTVGLFVGWRRPR